MNIEEFREYCISKPFVSECFPFDNDTLVFKVLGKMFALTSLSATFNINIKCDPERAIALREEYPCVIPGFHMNKKHWNTVFIDGTVNDDVLKEWIDHSYELVVSSLPAKERAKFGQTVSSRQSPVASLQSSVFSLQSPISLLLSYVRQLI